MSTTSVNPVTEAVTYVKAAKPAAKNVLNLDTFEKETKTADYEYPVYNTVEALRDVPSEKLLELVNRGAQREALLSAKRSIEGADTTIFAKILAGFALNPDFAKIENRTERRQAIVKFWKDNGMFEGLKTVFSASAIAATEEDSDEDSD